eukprot:scaffold1384_cov116-Cylindrotheca_fusiformis.AAC.19
MMTLDGDSVTAAAYKDNFGYSVDLSLDGDRVAASAYWGMFVEVFELGSDWLEPQSNCSDA